jgi:hypothetical protein
MMPRATRRYVALLALCVPLTAARAQDNGPNLDRLTGFDFGGRYWYSTGRIGYNYYGDTTSAMLVSRLTYDNLTANSGEAYFRADIAWGLFLKGTIGAGSIGGGHLFDEDFPPGIDPYSKTSSDTRGTLNFGNLDLGYSFIHAPRARLGAFVGYGRWHEVANASGCTQLAGNPEVCVPGLASGIPVIQETDTWNLLRVGLTGDVMLADRLKLSGEAAYIRASQKALDNHYFTFGLDPASGNGSGYQLETVLAYQLTNAFNIGVGARWWHLDTNATDSFDQLLTYDTNRYGVFFQGGLTLN